MKNIQIETINSCNATCVFCPNSRMARPKGVMRMDLFKKIIDDCVELNPEYVLPFLNGEPFFDPSIFERIKYINDVLPSSKVKLFSNGNLLCEFKREQIKELRVADINFSINAPTNESRMAIMGLELDKAVENILALREEDDTITITVSAVVGSAHISKEEIDQVAAFWQGKGIQTMFIMEGNWAGTTRQSISNRSVCPRPSNDMTVLVDGTVNLCCFDIEGAVTFGDLNKQSVEEVWHSEGHQYYEAMNASGNRRKLKLCSNCTTI